ncbi:MAG: hypothetical protein BroJett018_06580 [Chloroflexota bacterium]|nr:hypothetical protein [Chloroflexota bacterium]NOG63054.1 hypothetical protein [Chloroflexota bacterium]GIK62864.1 MAG: hypothetical protein BroJett018_06580 [Chloroflexota bacterium]
MRNILLFDVDGVLIYPEGYKVALRRTIGYFGSLMGHPPIHFTDDEISIFEACGLTNEWDSAAFAVGLMLTQALAEHPNLQADTLEGTFANIRQSANPYPRRDFVSHVREVAARNSNGDAPTSHALAYLQEFANHPFLPLFLGDIYSLDTPTTRIQQVHTLGSDGFARTYGLPAPFETESTLLVYDVPLLSESSKATLFNWRNQPDHDFVVFTARPSLPPRDADSDPLGYAPEGDFAVDLLGFHDVPLIGAGRMQWIASHYNRTPGEYIKPYPVQALAAMGAAISGKEAESLHAAAILFEQKRLTGPLAELIHQPNRVTVFEDSTGGIRATRLAVELLRGAGVEIEFQAIGVSPHADKQAALRQVANQVVDDVNKGLNAIINMVE